MKVIPVNAEAKRFKKANKVLEKYYGTADMDELRDISLRVSWPGIPLKSRKRSFRRYRKTILALKPLFKQHVIELNEVARKDGFKNRVAYMNHSNGIPQEKFELFLEKADYIIKILNQKFPEPSAEWADWYWSKYNIPDAPCLVTKKKYVVPDDIVKIMKKKAPKVAAILPKIEIQKLDDFFSSARYDKKKKKVIISTPLRKTSICGALSFIHEISHAVVMLDCVKKGIDPLSKSKYWGEKEAYRVESKLIKKLFSKKVHEAWFADFLGSFVSTLFQHEIYNHSERNFDRAFARAKNRCYLTAHQRENPFYVLNAHLINRSGCSTMPAVAITELLLEGKI